MTINVADGRNACITIESLRGEQSLASDTKNPRAISVLNPAIATIAHVTSTARNVEMVSVCVAVIALKEHSLIPCKFLPGRQTAQCIVVRMNHHHNEILFRRRERHFHGRSRAQPNGICPRRTNAINAFDFHFIARTIHVRASGIAAHFINRVVLVRAGSAVVVYAMRIAAIVALRNVHNMSRIDCIVTGRAATAGRSTNARRCAGLKNLEHLRKIVGKAAPVQRRTDSGKVQVAAGGSDQLQTVISMAVVCIRDHLENGIIVGSSIDMPNNARAVVVIVVEAVIAAGTLNNSAVSCTTRFKCQALVGVVGAAVQSDSVAVRDSAGRVVTTRCSRMMVPQ